MSPSLSLGRVENLAQRSKLSFKNPQERKRVSLAGVCPTRASIRGATPFQTGGDTASFYSTLISDLSVLELKAEITSWNSVSNYLIYIGARLLLNGPKIALVSS